MVENGAHEITSFFSTFDIVSSIANNKKYKEFTATYAYYYFTDEHTSIKDLFQAALTLSKQVCSPLRSSILVERIGCLQCFGCHAQC